ncbi:hypothetical protein ILUMI_03375 [Ignelater luminosus]|uniref:Carboxylesterase type B domain-containing protein n=1 Tax=Ignelater luminosus TaxID=2038154 RepID=A0A8K0DAW9_IGNLU|nr:hypothetical protein ILUMI_03375 [Ignelater luminosus]
MILVLVVTILLVFSGIFANESTLDVKIEQGILRGKYQESYKGRQFSAFTGIPYAEPPVGDLRFKAAVPAKPWDGILDATKLHSVCPQINPVTENFEIIGNEDCLYLNVYTPQVPSSENQLLPVMFYIHGGAYVVGSARQDWYEPDKLLDKDIVLVIPNYRLGPLGFLSTGDEVVPGNNGLKDVVLALNWTKNNIKAFGGNPNKITTVGHSAGSAISQFLMLSPLSKDLISGTIAQSASALSGWALGSNEKQIKNAKRLAEFLNCPTSPNDRMVDCLRKVEANEIVKQEPKYLEWALDPMIHFKPVIEPDLNGAFITEHPLDIVKSGKAANVPFLIGITTEDGALKSAGYYHNPQWIDDIDRDFNRVIQISLQYGNNNAKKEKISKELRQFYFGSKKIDNTTKSELTNLYTDIIFLMPADVSVRLHLKYNTQPVYYYLFGYRGSETHSKFYGDPSHNYGVCHSDELLYLFKLKQSFPNYQPNKTDKKMEDVLITLWANFVTNGNPTPETNSIIPTVWESAKLEKDLNYLFIKSPNDMQMKKGLHTERARFLEKLDMYSSTPTMRNEL